MKISLLKYSILVVSMLIAAIVFYNQCSSKPEKTTSHQAYPVELKLSLAQWSIHRALEDGTLKAEDFAAIARNDFGIYAVEYVNGFYTDHATDKAFWQMMRHRADSLGVQSLLIMIDDEGDLGNPDETERNLAIHQHKKWIDAARILGCHSVRINAFGEGSREDVRDAMVDALKKLCAYASESTINILIENHGLYSSDGTWIAEIVQKVNMHNCGTLPDFGNWCTAAKWGSTEPQKNCGEAYDRYQGVSEMLPFARGVSAKSYTFDDQGEEMVIDYTRMMQIVKNSGFDGYIGIEYEGSQLSESEGIMATKKLLEKTWKKIN
jgi:L-ribulose-5-phosphate 3-epimerase